MFFLNLFFVCFFFFFATNMRLSGIDDINCIVLDPEKSNELLGI